MLSIIKKIGHIKIAVKGLMMLTLLLAGQVFAKMPTMEDPTQGKQTGLLATIQAYIYDGGALAGLVIVAAALFVVAKSILIEYNNIGEGKGSWGKFSTLVVVGVVLVVACIWFATMAADTLLN